MIVYARLVRCSNTSSEIVEINLEPLDFIIYESNIITDKRWIAVWEDIIVRQCKNKIDYDFYIDAVEKYREDLQVCY